MFGFSLILGMAWLLAIIECDCCRITLSLEMGMLVHFIGDQAVLHIITSKVRNILNSLYALLNIEEVVPESSKIKD